MLYSYAKFVCNQNSYIVSKKKKKKSYINNVIIA